jgi:hypothetical protein
LDALDMLDTLDTLDTSKDTRRDHAGFTGGHFGVLPRIFGVL